MQTAFLSIFFKANYEQVRHQNLRRRKNVRELKCVFKIRFFYGKHPATQNPAHRFNTQSYVVDISL
jgi:hypothetical protein